MYIYVYIGAIPNTFCQLTSLINLFITYSGNPGITCAPLCVSSVTTRSVPSTMCPSNQDIGLCGMTAATNIQSISGYSQWSCTTGGVTSTAPCSTPLWNGLGCSGSNVMFISVSSTTLRGNI